METGVPVWVSVISGIVPLSVGNATQKGPEPEPPDKYFENCIE